MTTSSSPFASAKWATLAPAGSAASVGAVNAKLSVKAVAAAPPSQANDLKVTLGIFQAFVVAAPRLTENRNRIGTDKRINGRCRRRRDLPAWVCRDDISLSLCSTHRAARATASGNPAAARSTQHAAVHG